MADTTLKVNGEKIVLSEAVITELHRQEKIQWGKDIAASFVSNKKFKKITDSEFEKIAELLENKMLENNGEMEQEVTETILGEDYLNS